MSQAEHDEISDEEFQQLTEEALGKAIQLTRQHSKDDCVARALLYLLTRVANTWRSINTLWKALREDTPETFMVDAGTLLRAMFEAYVQAAYIAQEPKEQEGRARLYLDLEHVEKKEILDRLFQHDTYISSRLKESPRRPSGEKRLQEEYRRVKDRYSGPKWYSADAGHLHQLASQVGAESEYHLFVYAFHPYVHSSAYGVRSGPPIEPEYIQTLTSVIAGRVAKICISYLSANLGHPHQTVLDALSAHSLDETE